MNQDTALQELDYLIKESKKTIELGASLNRLMNNKDFKAVILDGYLREEAIRLVNLKGSPEIEGDPKKEAAVMKQIDSIGSFAGYLRTVFQMTQRAEKELVDCEQTREELLQEGE